MFLDRMILCTSFIVTIVSGVRCEEPKTGTDKYPFEVTVRGKGKPMILIPGLACSGAVWDDTVKHFDKKFECHVLTLAGFAGVKPHEGPFVDTVRDGIIRYIGDKKLDQPVIVGHSIGGFLAYELGIAAPKVVGPLIAVDGLPFLPAIRDAKMTEELMKQSATAIAKRTAELSRTEFLRQQESTLAIWIDNKTKRELPIKWGADSDQATVGKAVADMISRDLREKVSKIQAPVLLVAAPVSFGFITKDEATKRYMAQVEKIPKKEIAIAEKSKHFVMFDEPDWLWKQIEEFVAKHR